MTQSRQQNRDERTIESFGSEWQEFNQQDLSEKELEEIYNGYFKIFPWDKLESDAEGFDMGSGSGRWAKFVAPRVKKLNCIEPAVDAINVSKKLLAEQSNIEFHNTDLDNVTIKNGSQNFGYSLGVLHHIPDTAAALKSCVALLKPGAPFLLYLYYNFENRPLWFRMIWKLSNLLRLLISGLPETSKKKSTDLIALFIYLPMAKLAWALERLGVNASFLPLYFYRNSSFYTMRTDSRDRFGTPLEQRFSREEMFDMMSSAGLGEIAFSKEEPYWVATGTKTSKPQTQSATKQENP